VQGVRTETEGEGPLKRWPSRFFYRLLPLMGSPAVPIGSADFRLLARPVIERCVGRIFVAQLNRPHFVVKRRL
jgi:hypothetical protein